MFAELDTLASKILECIYAKNQTHLAAKNCVLKPTMTTPAAGNTLYFLDTECTVDGTVADRQTEKAIIMFAQKY